MRILLLFVLLSVFLFPQDDKKSQGVELPDFVITGKESFDFPAIIKDKPNVVSTVSQQFLTPLFTPEDLAVRDFSDPFQQNISLFDSTNFRKGTAHFELGNLYLPSGDFNVTFNPSNWLLNLNGSVSNRRAYVENSDAFKYGIAGNAKYYFSKESSFLSSSLFNTEASFNSYTNKFFAFIDPGKRKNVNNGLIGLELSKPTDGVFQYQIGLNQNFIYSDLNDFKENLFKFFLSSAIKTEKFNLKVGGEILRQRTDIKPLNELTNTFNKFFSRMLLTPSNLFNLSIGLEYAKMDTLSDLFIQAEAFYKIDEGVIIFAKYNPNASFISQIDFFNLNPYYGFQQSGLYFKKSSAFDAGVRYEYKRILSGNLGFKTYSSKYQPYFNDDLSNGIFQVNITEATMYSFFLDATWFPNKYGYVSVYFETLEMKDTSEMRLPYFPSYNFSTTYGHQFNSKWSGMIKFYLSGERYTDLANKNKLDSFFNISLSASYAFVENFKLTASLNNLLGKEYQLWKGYKEPGLWVQIGLGYTW